MEEFIFDVDFVKTVLFYYFPGIEPWLKGGDSMTPASHISCVHWNWNVQDGSALVLRPGIFVATGTWIDLLQASEETFEWKSQLQRKALEQHI